MAAGHRKDIPLVVIVGPTGSGKTSLAIELAQEIGGEIICADSRTIYRGLDIGSAKPTAYEQRLVPHWGIDLVWPGEKFSVADFKRYADLKIEEIRARGRTPFLVGGTGLYVDAVIFNYSFGNKADELLRARLNEMTLDELYKYCNNNNVKLPENYKNKRYVIRAIEQKGYANRGNDELRENTIIVGISTEKEMLIKKLHDRVSMMLNEGVVKEAIKISNHYGWNNEAMTGNMYRTVKKYLDDGLSIDEVVAEATTLDWRLAKRQLTWLKRNEYINWKALDEAADYVRQRLANE